MNKLLALATIFYRIVYIRVIKLWIKKIGNGMTLLERTKEFFNMAKKGMLIWVDSGILH